MRGACHLELTFDQLTLIHKSLQAVRTIGALPPRDELLEDTIELVDQALDRAVHKGLRLEGEAGLRAA
jgi:hypothetical protein